MPRGSVHGRDSYKGSGTGERDGKAGNRGRVCVVQRHRRPPSFTLLPSLCWGCANAADQEKSEPRNFRSLRRSRPSTQQLC